MKQVMCMTLFLCLLHAPIFKVFYQFTFISLIRKGFPSISIWKITCNVVQNKNDVSEASVSNLCQRHKERTHLLHDIEVIILKHRMPCSSFSSQYCHRLPAFVWGKAKVACMLIPIQLLYYGILWHVEGS